MHKALQPGDNLDYMCQEKEENIVEASIGELH